jgi:hypothetical protein
MSAVFLERENWRTDQPGSPEEDSKEMAHYFVLSY